MKAAVFPLLFVASLVWSSTTMASAPMTNSRSFHLDASCAQVFPLFTAQGEKQWAPGWDPEVLSGDTERGSVFRTSSHHDHRETIWVVTIYQPDQHRVAYARIAQGSNMGLVDVTCLGASGGGADITVRYTLTGLSTEGDAFVREFLSDAHYTRFIEEWHSALSALLAKN